MYPAEYCATVFDNDNCTIERVHGILFCKNFTDAMKKIEKYYGEDLCDIKIMLLEESSVYEFEYNLKTWNESGVSFDGSFSWKDSSTTVDQNVKDF